MISQKTLDKRTSCFYDWADQNGNQEGCSLQGPLTSTSRVSRCKAPLRLIQPGLPCSKQQLLSPELFHKPSPVSTSTASGTNSWPSGSASNGAFCPDQSQRSPVGRHWGVTCGRASEHLCFACRFLAKPQKTRTPRNPAKGTSSPPSSPTLASSIAITGL